jgi:hypothetical protein
MLRHGACAGFFTDVLKVSVQAAIQGSSLCVQVKHSGISHHQAQPLYAHMVCEYGEDNVPLITGDSSEDEDGSEDSDDVRDAP